MWEELVDGGAIPFRDPRLREHLHDDDVNRRLVAGGLAHRRDRHGGDSPILLGLGRLSRLLRGRLVAHDILLCRTCGRVFCSSPLAATMFFEKTVSCESDKPYHFLPFLSIEKESLSWRWPTLPASGGDYPPKADADGLSAQG